MKIKVCGTRDTNNIGELIKLPIDMLGFIFHPASPRYVGKQKSLPAWLKEHEEEFGEIQRVGVFVNSEIDLILNAVHDYGLDLVQLHGSEPPEYLAELQSFWDMSSLRKAGLVKAFGVDEAFNFEQTNRYVPYCRFFIFDTKTPNHGGSGKQFNWSILDKYQGPTPFLLSGGIAPDSIDEIKKCTHPNLMGIDINSRFETEPGIKDIATIKAFIENL